MTIAEDWSVEALIECVEHTDSHVVFADPMANIGELPCFDFQALANALRTRDWRNRWLVIDGTMISVASTLSRCSMRHIIHKFSTSKAAANTCSWGWICKCSAWLFAASNMPLPSPDTDATWALA